MNRTVCLKVRTILFCLILCAAGGLGALYADTVRGNLTASVSAGNDETSFNLFDLVEISPIESTIARSVELIITVPRSFLRYRDSFSISLYGDISSPLGKGMQQASGTLLLQKLLPPSGRIMLLLPLTDARGESGPGVLSPERRINPSSFPLVIQIVPIMKGLPSELMNADIGLTTKLLLEDAGFLDIDLQMPEEYGLSGDTDLRNAEVLLDESPADPAILISRQKLKSGLHSIKVTIPGFGSEILTFNINRGEVTALSIAPRPLESRYTIQAPEGTVVFLNGKQLDPGEIAGGTLPPGEHVVLFRIGDYQLSRKINVSGGKNYNIELFFDIIVEDR
jgi:hypothetical protein